MFFLYQIIISLIVLFSPIIILFRIFKNKEDKKRFIEKFCIFGKKRKKGNIIWIHAASVGEFMSIVPLIHELEKNKEINHILITTSTLSSSKIFKNFVFKKTIHQFFPIDFFFFTKKFIKYWKPKIAIFIDSEIWPSMYKELKKFSIPLLLLNARITPKSSSRWRLFHNFARDIFNNIDIAYPQNKETKKFLKDLKVKNINEIGNIKFSESHSKHDLKFQKSFLKQINKRLILCASSTHYGEESIIAKAHLILKNKNKNLLTIIIPRHVDRAEEIINELESFRLNIIKRSSNKKINQNTDIYLVDSYGETKKFFKISKIAFIGGSLVNHGGQNPIEPIRFGLDILHGPYVQNFKDIYRLFNKKKIAYKISNLNKFVSISNKLLTNKKNKRLDLNIMGKSILKKTVKEVNKVFSNEFKKT